MTNHKRGKHYLPTTEQIRHQCALIQRSWTERQRQNRAGRSPEGVRIPVYPAECFAENAWANSDPDASPVEGTL
jgi:hypothetical protein